MWGIILIWAYTVNVYPVHVILSLFGFARGQIPYSTIQK